MLESIFTFVLLLFLIIFSAFFSASEIAFFSLSRVRVRRLVKQGMPGALLIEEIKNKPERLITVILVGNNVVNISASAIATGLAINYFGDAGVGIATGVMTFLILTFGEIVPKTIAVAHAETVARYSAPILKFLQFILFPIIFFFEFIPKLFVKTDPTKPLLTERELRSILEIGVDEKAIEASEHQMIMRLLDFRDTPVRNAMLPINNATMLNADVSVINAKEITIEKGFSRYPVYSKDIERVIGIVHTKHLDRLIKERKGDMSLRSVLSQDGPILISEKEHLDSLFRKMQKEHIHMAVVVDDKWNQIGIISFEDLLEEIFGDIADEEERKRSKKKKS